MGSLAMMGAGLASASEATSPPPPPPPPPISAWDPSKKASNVGLSTVTATNDTATGDGTNYGTVLTVTGYTYSATGTVVFLINDPDGSIGLATVGQSLGPGSDGYLGNGFKTGVQVSPNGDIFYNNGVAGNVGFTFTTGDQITQVHDSNLATVTWAKNGGAPSSPFSIADISPSFNSTFYAGFTTNTDGGVTIISTSW